MIITVARARSAKATSACHVIEKHERSTALLRFSEINSQSGVSFLDSRDGMGAKERGEHYVFLPLRLQFLGNSFRVTMYKL